MGRCHPRKTPGSQMGRVPEGWPDHARTAPDAPVTRLCPRTENYNPTELYGSPQSQWHFKTVIQGSVFHYQPETPEKSARTFRNPYIPGGLCFCCFYLFAYFWLHWVLLLSTGFLSLQ